MEDKPKVRRSFVDLRRKSLVFDKMFTEENEVSCKENSNLTMDKYLASLREESMQWKDILNLRRKQLENIRNSCNSESMNITESEVKTFLTEDEKKFLEEKPNYINMMEHANKYLQAVEFFKRYKSDVIEYYNEIVEEIKTETDILVEHLCQNDICELCNQMNCTLSSHKFPIY